MADRQDPRSPYLLRRQKENTHAQDQASTLLIPAIASKAPRPPLVPILLPRRNVDTLPNNFLRKPSVTFLDARSTRLKSKRVIVGQSLIHATALSSENRYFSNQPRFIGKRPPAAVRVKNSPGTVVEARDNDCMANSLDTATSSPSLCTPCACPSLRVKPAESSFCVDHSQCCSAEVSVPVDFADDLEENIPLCQMVSALIYALLLAAWLLCNLMLWTSSLPGLGGHNSAYSLEGR
ncbi:unnamed protein product [Somion occarium]|uniref:Uncharacterized protein n=1 Tax=Somion occarium TaxID=3059160 RepID=A0ABP1DR27_9APHY